MLVVSKVKTVGIETEYYGASAEKPINYEYIDVKDIKDYRELYAQRLDKAKKMILKDYPNLKEEDLKFTSFNTIKRYHDEDPVTIFAFVLSEPKDIRYAEEWYMEENTDFMVGLYSEEDNMGFISEIETINIYPNYNEANRECDYFIEYDKSKIKSMESFIEERLKKSKEYIESRLGAKLSGKEKASYHINNPVDYFYGDEFGYLIVRDPDSKFTYDECWRLGTRAVYTSPNRESEGYDIDVNLPK